MRKNLQIEHNISIGIMSYLDKFQFVTKAKGAPFTKVLNISYNSKYLGNVVPIWDVLLLSRPTFQ
jgi:hypothetical protein